MKLAFGNNTLEFSYKKQKNTVAVNWDKKCLFTGSFFKADEAQLWMKQAYESLQHLLRHLRYENRTAKSWYQQFFSNHFLQLYAQFLDQTSSSATSRHKAPQKLHKNWARYGENRIKRVG